jgi:hypothetical protein
MRRGGEKSQLVAFERCDDVIASLPEVRQLILIDGGVMVLSVEASAGGLSLSYRHPATSV